MNKRKTGAIDRHKTPRSTETRRQEIINERSSHSVCPLAITERPQNVRVSTQLTWHAIWAVTTSFFPDHSSTVIREGRGGQAYESLKTIQFSIELVRPGFP